MTEQVTLLLAAPTDRVRAWYQALIGDARFRVLSGTSDLGNLARKLETFSADALILDAGLFPGPAALEETLAGMHFTAVYVLLPAETDEEAAGRVRALPAVRGGWQGDVNLAAEAGRIYTDVLAGSGSRTVEAPARPAAPPAPAAHSTPPPAARPGAVGGRRAVAFWSGPAGGTGRTTLALALALLAAEWEQDVVLLALVEPAVSVYLHLPRVPNASGFFESGRLPAVEQAVTWQRPDGTEAALRVVLGPARPRDGAVDAGRIGALVEAACVAHGLAILDVPALAPGGNAWTFEPLIRASDVALVVPPTLSGVAATVEALVTLKDLNAPGLAHLVLNRRSPGGLATRKFSDAVEQPWGSCPPIAAEISPAPDLPPLLDRGELLDAFLGGTEFAQEVARLGGALLGLAQPQAERVARESGKVKPPRPRRAGRLIQVEVAE